MTKHKRYSLPEIMQMDQYLMNLAAYESSEGMITVPQTIDDAIKFQQTIKHQFNVFKRMIQCNECTLEELEQMVLRRHGPIPNPYSNMTIDETLEEISKEEEVEKEEEQIPDFLSMFIQEFQNSLPEGTVLVSPSLNGNPPQLNNKENTCSPKQITEKEKPEQSKRKTDNKKRVTKKKTSKKVPTKKNSKTKR
jgi:hypothetical protein